MIGRVQLRGQAAFTVQRPGAPPPPPPTHPVVISPAPLQLAQRVKLCKISVSKFFSYKTNSQKHKKWKKPQRRLGKDLGLRALKANSSAEKRMRTSIRSNKGFSFWTTSLAMDMLGMVVFQSSFGMILFFCFFFVLVVHLEVRESLRWQLWLLLLTKKNPK